MPARKTRQVKQIDTSRDRAVALSKRLLGACLITLSAWIGLGTA
jgi:hypothetical protein